MTAYGGNTIFLVCNLEHKMPCRRQEFDLGTLYYIHVHIFPNVHLSLYIHVGVT